MEAYLEKELDLLKQIAQEAYWREFGECRNVHATCSVGDMASKLLDYDALRGNKPMAFPTRATLDRAAWLTIDEMEEVILDATLSLPVKGTGMPRYIAEKIAKASIAKKVRITACAGCFGSSFDTRFQCSGCVDHSKYEPKEN